MTILVTGAAGFIGAAVSRHLLQRGDQVIGVDCVNDYYDPALKEARLARLSGQKGFSFQRIDIADRAAMEALASSRGGEIDGIVHLAAQAGVRYSLVNPFAYVTSNLVGHMTVLELARHLPSLRHLVYASSSSVYGGNSKVPFSIEDRVDDPLSLYAATKRADELMAFNYSHLFGLPLTGLRFFTVYGPWGRPDLSYYIFTQAILTGKPITVFNGGNMKRDFTYVDDVVQGVLAALDRPPKRGESRLATGTIAFEPPHRLYNIGNCRSEPLMRFIEVIERACGAKATIEFAPLQPGDVLETFADIEASTRDLGFVPRTAIDDGIPRFVAWFRGYHRL